MKIRTNIREHLFFREQVVVVLCFFSLACAWLVLVSKPLAASGLFS